MVFIGGPSKLVNGWLDVYVINNSPPSPSTLLFSPATPTNRIRGICIRFHQLLRIALFPLANEPGPFVGIISTNEQQQPVGGWLSEQEALMTIIIPNGVCMFCTRRTFIRPEGCRRVPPEWPGGGDGGV